MTQSAARQMRTHGDASIDAADAVTRQKADSARQASTLETAKLSELTGGLGYDIVDIGAFLTEVDQQASKQLSVLDELDQIASLLQSSNREIGGSAQRVAASSLETFEVTQRSVKRVKVASDKTHQVANWVQSIDQRINELSQSVAMISADIEEISTIAKMVNILALNASIEAYRAGEAGRGFAVVAKEVNDLSHKTEQAAGSISGNIRQLSEWTRALRKEAREISSHADEVISGTMQTNDSLKQISNSIQQVSQEATNITDQASRVETAANRLGPAVQDVLADSRKNAAGVHQATSRINSLIDRSEAIVQETAALGGKSEDSEYIECAMHIASQIRSCFEEAVKTDELSIAELFDDRYQSIPGTNPQQYIARFTPFTDKHLMDIQEAALKFSEKTAFCAAIDRNGYLPTHNQKFSQPQTDDPVWNAANSRNRRIYDDRVGLKAGRNQEPFLLQVYRRDLGGGQFVIMKDVSAPISVNGRHWGGLRLGYRF